MMEENREEDERSSMEPERTETGDAAAPEDARADDYPRAEIPEDAGEESDGEDGGEPEDSGDDSDEETEEDEAGEERLPLASIVEAVLFAAREPLKIAQIARAVGKRTRQDAVRQAIEDLNVQYLETVRAFEIAEISGRYQLMSRPEYARHIMRIYPKRELAEKDKSHRLTPTALDTLAIIAYKQPVTRGDIEHIRGVACGSILKTLIERGTVKVVGKRTDLVGQPRVYGTTEAFLAEFGLGSLDELPLRNDFLGILGDEQGAVELFTESGEDASAPESSPEEVDSPPPANEEPNPAATGDEPGAVERFPASEDDSSTPESSPEEAEPSLPANEEPNPAADGDEPDAEEAGETGEPPRDMIVETAEPDRDAGEENEIA